MTKLIKLRRLKNSLMNWEILKIKERIVLQDFIIKIANIRLKIIKKIKKKLFPPNLQLNRYPIEKY